MKGIIKLRFLILAFAAVMLFAAFSTISPNNSAMIILLALVVVLLILHYIFEDEEYDLDNC